MTFKLIKFNCKKKIKKNIQMIEIKIKKTMK